MLGILDIMFEDQFLGFLMIGIGLSSMLGRGIGGSSVKTGVGLVRRKQGENKSLCNTESLLKPTFKDIAPYIAMHRHRQ